jgi:hypothetical protein
MPGLVILLLMLILALVARLKVLQDLSEAALGCRWCITPGVLQADIPLLTALAASFLIGQCFSRRLWSFPWRLLAVAGLALYLADVWVMSQFHTRLMIADARIHLGQPDLVWRHLGTLSIAQVVLAILVIGGLTGLCLARPRHALSPRGFIASGVALLSLSLVSHLAIPAPVYVHEWALRNVLVANLDDGLTQAYSTRTRQHWLADAEDTPTRQCHPGRARKDNIVVLILESWSPYHSQAWSGLNDWTPRLDALARQGLRFRRLHAGGFNTNEGLISLLTGRDVLLPLTLPQQQRPFEWAWGLEDTLPRQIREQGYHSAFLTSGNLAYTRKGEWLEDIGFDEIGGHDHPAYDGLPRLHFDAAPDADLYERSLAYIDSQGSRPHVTVIESVSTHHPFIHPETGERSEEAVFRYMDDTTSDFIAGLEAQNVLEGGILVVISDHRAMTLVSAAEQRLLGRGAASRIPGFILTGDPDDAREVDQRFHQADLPPTLLRHVSSEHCQSGPERDMLAPEESEPRCMMHARGDRRDHVDVFCPSGEGTLRVAGDESGFIDSEGLDKSRRMELLDQLARQRILCDAEGCP